MKFSLSLYLFSDKIVCKSADGWQKVQRTLNFSPATPPFLAAALATRMSTDIVWLICANFLHKNTITAAVEKKVMKERKSKCPFLSHHFCHPSPRATFTFHIFVFFLPLLLNLFSQFVCLDKCVCVCVFGLFFLLHFTSILHNFSRSSAVGGGCCIH